MSNIMSNLKLRNNPSRNGFDLTKRNTFSAKIGELLPVYCKEVLPDDVFKIKLDSFSRTQPLMSPAFIRLREYYDFVYVPTRLLWKYADNFYDTMPNDTASNSATTETQYLTRTPWVTRQQIVNYLALLSGLNDDIGLDRKYQAEKLLDYLDYGQTWYDVTVNPEASNVAYNLFPLLAYQKAYNDIYRFDQWEYPTPHTFNLDWVNNTSSAVTLPSSVANVPQYDYFSMRYANYQKDLLMGLLPNSQFGDVSLVSTTSDGFTALITPDTAGSSQYLRASSGSSATILNTKSNIDSIFNFNILALRKAEFLQKFREISIANKQDHVSQLAAHWDAKLSKGRSQLCEYLGGMTANVQIDTVTNQNIASSTDKTFQKGTAVSGANGFIHFTVPEHGYILCIYHAAPLLDYDASTMIDPQNLKTTPSDFAIPEFDKAGMQSIPREWFSGAYSRYQSDPDDANTSYSLPYVFGYAPRYIEYKTDLDKTHGVFEPNRVGTYAQWVSPMTFEKIFESLRNGELNYLNFKVKPQLFDEIFGVQVNTDVSSDQLLCCADFDVKAVRKLDVNGMPY